MEAFQLTESAGMLVPIALLAEGDEAEIADIKGAANICSRLVSLGIHPGMKAKVLRSGQGHGPILVEIGGTRIGLGRSICMNILTSGGASVEKALSAESESSEFETCEPKCGCTAHGRNRRGRFFKLPW